MNRIVASDAIKGLREVLRWRLTLDRLENSRPKPGAQ